MAIEKCRNRGCEYNRRSGQGCKLFEGLNFIRCTQCIV